MTPLRTPALVLAVLLHAVTAAAASAGVAQDAAGAQARAQDPARAQAEPLSAQGTAAQPQVVQETELDRQTRAVSSQLRCVVCQGLSLEDSPSQLAQEMRAVVREQLAMGRTPAEVRQYFVEKYGEWVLLEPEARGFNLVVYILPLLMLVGGAVFVYVTARRMTRAGAPDTTAVGGTRLEGEVTGGPGMS